MAHDSPISDCIPVTHNGMMHALDTPEMRDCGRVIRSSKELKGGKISVPHRLIRLGRPSLGGLRRHCPCVCLGRDRHLLVDERAAAGAGRREGREEEMGEGVVRSRVRVAARPVAVSEYAAADTCPPYCALPKPGLACPRVAVVYFGLGRIDASRGSGVGHLLAWGRLCGQRRLE